MKFPFHSKLGTELWCIWLENKREKTITAIILKPILLVKRIREMLSFELGKEMEKDVLRLVTSVGQRKKIWVPTRNRTSYLRIPLSYAMRLYGGRGLLRSSYETLHTARIYNVDSVMFVNNVHGDSEFFSCSHARDKTKNIFLYSTGETYWNLPLRYRFFHFNFVRFHLFRYLTKYFLPRFFIEYLRRPRLMKFCRRFLIGNHFLRNRILYFPLRHRTKRLTPLNRNLRIHLK